VSRTVERLLEEQFLFYVPRSRTQLMNEKPLRLVDDYNTDEGRYLRDHRVAKDQWAARDENGAASVGLGLGLVGMCFLASLSLLFGLSLERFGICREFALSGSREHDTWLASDRPAWLT